VEGGCAGEVVVGYELEGGGAGFTGGDLAGMAGCGQGLGGGARGSEDRSSGKEADTPQQRQRTGRRHVNDLDNRFVVRTDGTYRALPVMRLDTGSVGKVVMERGRNWETARYSHLKDWWYYSER